MIKTSAVTKLQNAFRNKRAINEFATEYAKKIIEERKVMNTANDAISQINKDKQSAATTIQNAFRRKKKLIDEEKNKQRQKELFKKYSNLYQPQDNLTLKANIIRPTEQKISLEADRKERQRKVFNKYINLYEPQTNLTYKPF